MITICHIENWLPSAAWAGVAAASSSALIALWGFWKQNKSYKESLALELVMKLDSQFNSAAFMKIRSDSAKVLLKQNSDDLVIAEDVFDFFETLGALLKRNSLDAELAYDFFFYWINLYWNAGKSYISTRRKHSNTLWADFEHLYDEVLKIEKRKDSSSQDINPSPEQIKDQLQDEI